MFDGRQIQWFCGQDALDKIAGDFGAPAYPLTPSPTQHWAAYTEACSTHQDCITRSGKPEQRCTAFLWDGSEDGLAFGAGTACYSWDKEVCPGPTFAIQNENYAGTKFSYYTQMWCKNEIASAEINMVVPQDMQLDENEKARRRRDEFWDEKTGQWVHPNAQNRVTSQDVGEVNRTVMSIFGLDAMKVASSAVAMLIASAINLN